jgi:hypothetical protein
MDTCSRLEEPGGVGWKDVNVGRLRTTTIVTGSGAAGDGILRRVPKISDFRPAERLALIRLRIVRGEKKAVETNEFVERALEAGDGIALDLRNHAVGKLLKKIGRLRQRIPAVFLGSETVALPDHPSFPAMESSAAPSAAPSHLSFEPVIKRGFEREPNIAGA